MRAFGVMAALAALILGGCTNEIGTAGDAFMSGSSVAKPLRVGQKTIPLPDGKWIIAGSERTYGTLGTPIENLVLLNTEKNAEILAVFVNTNLQRTAGSHWTLPSSCFRRDMLFVDGLQNYSEERHKCWYVNHIILGRTSRTSASILHALDVAHQRGMAVPTVGLYAYFHEADDSDEFSVGYLFDPSAAGIPVGSSSSWLVSDWHPDRIDTSTQRKAYVAKVIEWGRSWWPRVDDGFYGRVPP